MNNKIFKQNQYNQYLWVWRPKPNDSNSEHIAGQDRMVLNKTQFKNVYNPNAKLTKFKRSGNT